eukprot:GHVL01013932.1.p1 GENE.GHVL01013932.1~~GHVL01013932.1.p1  ORF type:complete len:387 (-),score=54.36 GHVL01013932.1:1386-2546(-)
MNIFLNIYKNIFIYIFISIIIIILYLIRKLLIRHAFKEGRKLGPFEKIMFQIDKVNGCLNVCTCTSFGSTLDEGVFKRAIIKVQKSHDILNVKNKSFLFCNGIVHDRELSEININIIHLSEPTNLSKKIISQKKDIRYYTILKEINTKFSINEPPIRATLIYNPIESGIKSIVILTVKHVLIDGKSVAFLATEIWDTYLNEMKNYVDDKIYVDKIAAPLPPCIKKLSYPPLVPNFVVVLGQIFNFIAMPIPTFVPRWRRCSKSQKSTSPTNMITSFSWSTGWVNRTLDKELTAKIIKVCKTNDVTVGNLLHSATHTVMTEKILDHSKHKRKTSPTIWGKVLTDMRLLCYDRFHPVTTAVGQFIAAVDIDICLLPKKITIDMKCRTF